MREEGKEGDRKGKGGEREGRKKPGKGGGREGRKKGGRKVREGEGGIVEWAESL